MIYKIVIADDHQLVATGMEQLIDGFANCEVLYKVANGQELLDKFATAKNIPDLVLLDINMPIMNGYQTMQELSMRHPKVKVLGLSMVDDEESYIKLIELGANGFISKMCSEEELHKAITAVMTKGLYNSEEVTKALIRLLQERSKDQKVAITTNEKQLLSYIGSEMTYPEIAKKMNVNYKTVDGYRGSLFKKLGVKSRTTLAIYAYVHGYYKQKPF